MNYFKISFTSFLLFHTLSNAQLVKDDYLHFGAGVLSGTAGAYVASELSDGDRWWTFTGAVASSIIAGTIKEAIDERKNGSWDNRDLGATVLGGITAGITIEIFSNKRRKRKLKLP